MNYQVLRNNFYLSSANEIFYSKILSVNQDNYKDIFEEIYKFNHSLELDASCHRPINLGQNILNINFIMDAYEGTILHHVIYSSEIFTQNLPFVIGVLIVCGSDFEKQKDSNGHTAYVCLTTYRYRGYKIFKDISDIKNELNSILTTKIVELV